jgi:CubicO group peptidase (beta-lactamase class C family)
VPSKLGLSAAALLKAANEYGEFASGTCLTVVRDGQIVLDKSYGFGAHGRLLESMSAGKTATAALMGVAHRMGLFSLDTPIHTYGIPSSLANWSANINRTDYYPLITARHLLSQTSGVGKYPPATRFTYDSYKYIEYLSYMLDKLAPDNQTALQFAQEHFNIPLGLPDL